MNAKQVNSDITALLRARNTLIWITSREEKRVESALIDACGAAKYSVLYWDCSTGVTELVLDPKTREPRVQTVESNTDPGAALRWLRGRKTRTVLVMRDLHKWMDPVILRTLRTLSRELQNTVPNESRAIVILTPSAEVPPELASATVIDYPLPDRADVAQILDDTIAALPADVQARVEASGTRDLTIDAALGLSAEEISNAFAKSLVTTKTIDVAMVSNEKRRVIARERVLTWHDPDPRGLDAVGGLGILKQWLNARRCAFTQEARDFGLDAPKGALLVGISGCLTGDTIINVSRKQRPGGYKGIRLDALFYRFNERHDEGAKLGLYGSGKWDMSHPTRAHSYHEDQKYIGFNDIEGVIYSGIKEVYRLTTDHGVEIKATPDHEFMTTNGFMRLDNLQPGDELLAYQNGVLADDNSTGRNRNKPIRQINNVGNHPFARRRVINGMDYSSHSLHRLVLEAGMNDLSLEQFLWALQGDTSKLEFLSENAEVHHRDHDRDNNTRDNLQVLTKAEHARLHMNERGVIARYKHAPRLQKVSKIVRVGKMPTYDVQMRGPHHNFVANGLVVHNCGKSLTAKAVASAWQMPLLRLDMGALRSKYVGDSEANIRKALRVAEAVSPCILWVDEIEKALAGAGGPAGDGGVAADALGTLLSWMQEREGSVFVIATANDVRNLPPELLRKGRFDELFWVDLPTKVERGQVLATALRQRNRNPDLVDVDEVSAFTEGFTGAEIAAIVPDALFSAFADGAREITTEDLRVSADTVVPLSKTAREKIDALREWAKGRARPASTPEATVGGDMRTLDL